MSSKTISLKESLKIFDLESLKGIDESKLKKLYLKKAVLYHPDRGGNAQDFIRLRLAYLFLRKKIQDPSQSRGDSTETSSDSKTENSTESNTKESYEDVIYELNRYKKAYQKLSDTLDHYEGIFNSQIKAVNKNNKELSGMYERYNNKRELMKSTLDDSIKRIKKQYNREWWEHIIPVKKLTDDQYISQYNQVVNAYNTESKKLEDEFFQELLNSYQVTLNTLIDLLQS